MRPLFEDNTLTFLVTGHTGFKGTWLSLVLKKLGHHVVGVSLPPVGNSLYQLLGEKSVDEEYFVDIRNNIQISQVIRDSKPDVVIHFAAQSLVLTSYQKPLETFEVNAIGTAHVLESSYKVSSVKSILVATTDKVYQNHNTGRKFIESDCLSGTDPYSASKVATEAVCLAWQSLSKSISGPKILVARAGNVVGGGDLNNQRLLPDIVRSYLHKTPVAVRNINATRPWQHVLDPLYGYLRYIELSICDESPHQLNFGPTESSKSVKEVLELAEDALGISYINQNADLHPPESTYLDLNSQLARERLNWSPRWTQREAINRTFEWWKSYKTSQLSPVECCIRDIEEYYAE